MTYQEKIKTILERNPFPLEEARAMSQILHDAGEMGIGLDPLEEELWEKLNLEILRHTGWVPAGHGEHGEGV